MISQEMFSGVQVLELASVLAGPSVGQFFAELGAEVIKVENPKSNGDVTRSWKTKEENTDDRSAYFSSVNWGKKSIALDYSSSKGLEILSDLVKQSDIVIVSFKPGDARKLKVDYDSLKAANPSILYGSITGYGEDEPFVGYDAVIQAESGFMSINGEVDGGPLKLPVALIDLLAGHQLKEALLLAYIHKLKSGEGSEVSVSLIDAAMASLANQAANWLVAGKEPSRSGSLHPNIAPYGEVFNTADNKQIILAIGNDKQFQNLSDLLSIQKDKRFSDNTLRVENRKQLYDLLETAISKWNSFDLLEKMNQRNIPAGLVNTISEAVARYNGLNIARDGLSGLKTFAAKMSNPQNPSHFLPPPHFGQHTRALLVDKIGLNNTEIDELAASRIVS